jgi:hypothetical protein
VVQLQKHDSVLKEIIHHLETQPARPKPVGPWRKSLLNLYRQLWNQLSLVDGMLVRSRKSGPQLATTTVTVLPAALIRDVLTVFHDDPFSGHLGIEKTTGRIQNQFYWAGYTTDIAQYVQTCDTCHAKTPVSNTNN